MYVSETRQSIWGLRSPVLEQPNVTAVLRETGESIIGSRPVGFEFVIGGTPRRCSPKIEEQLRRIGQEAVSNVVRHAHAKQLRMEVIYEDDVVRLRVTDDGCGFDPSDPVCRSVGHCGLATMQERAQEVRGSFTVSTVPAQGTRVEVVIPFAD
jgi:signal transduction histidine kinase